MTARISSALIVLLLAAPAAAQAQTLQLTLDDAVRRAVENIPELAIVRLGPEVEAFETEFASACGARFAVGVGNGTDAITLALRALDIGPGDDVIVPAVTAAFTGLAVIACGATPRIVDVERATLMLDTAA